MFSIHRKTPRQIFKNTFFYRTPLVAAFGLYESRILHKSFPCTFCKILWTTIVKFQRQEVFCKKVALENFVKFTGKHLYQFSFEFYEIFKNTFSYGTHPVAVSEVLKDSGSANCEHRRNSWNLSGFSQHKKMKFFIKDFFIFCAVFES